MSEDSEDEEFFYEGFWTRFTCPECGAQSEVEGDARGEQATCDQCNHSGVIGS